MRICCPLTGIVPGYQMTGAATYDRSIIEHLTVLGAEVHGILPEGRNWIESNRNGGGPTIHRVKMPLQPPLVFHAARALALPREVRALHKRCPFDLLRVHSFFSSCLDALWITSAANLSIPMVMHFFHLDTSPWRNTLVRRMMRRAKAVIASSHASKEQLVHQLGIEASKIHVVYLGVGREFQPAPPKRELREAVGWKQGEQILLYLGSLEPRKNPLFLLDVLADLLSQGQKVRLVLCGAGPLAETLRREIHRRSLERHAFLAGPVPERLKPDYYNLADVFLFPSALEGFGLSLAEAMSCGKPVVAFDNSSITEVVENRQTGFLVESGDLDEFSRNTALLLAQDALRTEMGCRAQERVERMFRWERAARQTLDVYREALAWPEGSLILEPNCEPKN